MERRIIRHSCSGASVVMSGAAHHSSTAMPVPYLLKRLRKPLLRLKTGAIGASSPASPLMARATGRDMSSIKFVTCPPEEPARAVRPTRCKCVTCVCVCMCVCVCVCVFVCVCVCVCVMVCERDSGRGRQRHRQRQYG